MAGEVGGEALLESAGAIAEIEAVREPVKAGGLEGGEESEGLGGDWEIPGVEALLAKDRRGLVGEKRRDGGPVVEEFGAAAGGLLGEVAGQGAALAAEFVQRSSTALAERRCAEVWRFGSAADVAVCGRGPETAGDHGGVQAGEEALVDEEAGQGVNVGRIVVEAQMSGQKTEPVGGVKESPGAGLSGEVQPGDPQMAMCGGVLSGPGRGGLPEISRVV